MLKAAKLLGKLILGIAACVVLAYLVLLAINWRDQPPSAATLKFHSLVAARPVVANADNGFVYALGFGAPADQDPIEIGSQRLAWLEKTDPFLGIRTGDPLKNAVEWHNRSAPEVNELAATCRDADRKACAEQFETLSRNWRRSDEDALVMARYETLLASNDWREIVPVDVSAPLPTYADILHGQRISMLRMRQLVEKGDIEPIHKFLSSDVVFWRNVQRDSDNLLTKMIAVAGLRNHFFFANLVLRRLPAAQQLAAVPSSWQLEFSAQERSMLRVMAGEAMFVENTLRDYKEGKETAYGVDDELELRGTVGLLLLQLGRPLFQLQQETNYFADRYLMLAEAFDVPLSGYDAAEAKVVAVDEIPDLHLYDLMGDLLRRQGPFSSLTDYPFRVASVEGMRRAALLTVQLRSRAVPTGQVKAELPTASLRDPYTNEPFQWNAETLSVLFKGPEVHRWSVQEYLY